MRYKLKLYLDTSVLSALFDERNPERKSLTEKEIKKNMKEKIANFSVLAISNEIEELAKDIIGKRAINEKYSEDAYHIAIAILNEMDFLLSWNFRQIEIITPAELL